MSDFNVLPPPSREEVSACWKSLIFGDLSREAAHGWAATWVEGPSVPDYPDPLVLTALQFLHGFDLSVDPQHPGLVRHGQGIAWCRSIQDISDEFSRWQANCAVYDSDPRLATVHVEAGAVLYRGREGQKPPGWRTCIGWMMRRITDAPG